MRGVRVGAGPRAPRRPVHSPAREGGCWGPREAAIRAPGGLQLVRCPGPWALASARKTALPE